MNTGWNPLMSLMTSALIINLLGNEYWLELPADKIAAVANYKPTGK